MEIMADWNRVRENTVTFLASGAFSGFIPALPGTSASLLAAALWWLLFPANSWGQLALLAAAAAAGFLAVRMAEGRWGEGDRRIVIQHLAGMWLVLWLFPRHLWLYAAGFAIYRFMDVIKFYPAPWCRDFGPGWGAVAEKLVVGVYSGTVLLAISLTREPLPVFGHLVFRAAVYGAVLAAAVAAHVYGSTAVGFRTMAAIPLAGYIWWRFIPGTPLLQAAVLVAAAALIAGAWRTRLAGSSFWPATGEFLGLMWCCWAGLWFIPKVPWLFLAGGFVLAWFKHMHPYPVNYLPKSRPAFRLLASNLISAAYTSIVLQVIVLALWPGRPVPISVATKTMLGLVGLGK